MLLSNLQEFTIFKRGLNQEALDGLGEFLRTPVGENLVKSSKYQLCIRDNYVNFYKNGCSVLRYMPLEKKKFFIHKKYICADSEKDDYLPLENVCDDCLEREIGEF